MSSAGSRPASWRCSAAAPSRTGRASSATTPSAPCVAMNQGDEQRAVALAQEALTRELLIMRTSRVAAMSARRGAFRSGRTAAGAETVRGSRAPRAGDQCLAPVVWSPASCRKSPSPRAICRRPIPCRSAPSSTSSSRTCRPRPSSSSSTGCAAVLLEWHQLDAAEQCALQGIQILDELDDPRWRL